MRFNRTIAALLAISQAIVVSSASAQTVPHAQLTESLRIASLAAPIEVTFGSLTGDPRFAGRAAVIEKNGGRVLQLSVKKLAHGSFGAKLVKRETLATGAFPSGVKTLDLGTLAAGAKSVPISKDIDVWLYRTVAIIDRKTGRIVAYANLRSAQETGK
jgi:hypothetical protein